MIAIYNNHVIKATKDGLNGWLTTIDGEPSGIEPTLYKRVAIKRAVTLLQERERIQQIKEVAL